MAPPPPELMEELVEDILLRFPPDDPASLVRAALVCKRWCRFVCGAAFRRRFREAHLGAAPMLGLLYGDYCDVRDDETPPRDPDRPMNLVAVSHVPIAYFAPTTSFRPAHAADGHYGWGAIDARHGRVLLHLIDPRWGGNGDLRVWDPITNEQRDLPVPPFHLQIAAVVCAAAAGGGGCDHLDCRGGPFLVVVMGVHYGGMHLSVYSSEAGAWSKATVCEGPNAYSLGMFNKVPGVLVRSALYILVHFRRNMIVNHEIKMIMNHEIVKYDLATRQASSIHLPSKFRQWKRSIVVMTDDDGGLGFVANVKDKLQLWSRVAGADGDAGFVLTRVIDLRKVLPSGALIEKKAWKPHLMKKPEVNGFVDGGASRVLFIRMFDGLYSIEMNSSQVSKLANSCGDGKVVPYISFCTPTSRLQH